MSAPQTAPQTAPQPLRQPPPQVRLPIWSKLLLVAGLILLVAACAFGLGDLAAASMAPEGEPQGDRVWLATAVAVTAVALMGLGFMPVFSRRRASKTKAEEAAPQPDPDKADPLEDAAAEDLFDI